MGPRRALLSLQGWLGGAAGVPKGEGLLVRSETMGTNSADMRIHRGTTGRLQGPPTTRVHTQAQAQPRESAGTALRGGRGRAEKRKHQGMQ